MREFPSDIDRDYFGAWLSGFTDGEGSFRLYYNNRGAGAQFRIKLRDDDLDSLLLIQSYFGCGEIELLRVTECCSPGANPQAAFRVGDVDSLIDVIIPHFERYPLIAKKKNDFLIWREAVELKYRVRLRSINGDRSRRPSYRYKNPSSLTRWTKDELQEFCDLVTKLELQREYRGNNAHSPE